MCSDGSAFDPAFGHVALRPYAIHFPLLATLDAMLLLVAFFFILLLPVEHSMRRIWDLWVKCYIHPRSD